MNRLIILLGWLLFGGVICAQAQTSDITERCTSPAVQRRGAEFEPGGVILTSFDSDSLWVYDIDNNTRYPLPQTRPCPSNCNLSPDARTLIYMNPETLVFERMRVDGTQRTTLIGGVADVQWWTPDTYLIWTPDHRAFLQPIETIATGDGREALPVDRVISIQPGGYAALALRQTEQGFMRYLTHLVDDVPPVDLTPDVAYFNTAVWAPDGSRLAYVGRGTVDDSLNVRGAELFFITPDEREPQQITNLTATYGAVRIDGYSSTSLSWSPDSRKIAFWVTELTGLDPTNDTGNAVIHVLDTVENTLTRYCGFATNEHTPTTPRIVWSPDGSMLAFGGNVPNDGKSYLLLALNLETGALTELSDGIYPTLGGANVVAWGRLP